MDVVNILDALENVDECIVDDDNVLGAEFLSVFLPWEMSFVITRTALA